MNKILFKISSTRKGGGRGGGNIYEEGISMEFMHDFAKARNSRKASRDFAAEVKP
jgi:hypothetical protein